MLKAHVVRTTGNIPPRSHNLLKLAELGNITLDEATVEFFGKLMVYQLEGRYPSEIPIKPSAVFANEMLETSRKKQLWLKHLLKKK